MAAAPAITYHFGAFICDPARRELLHDATPVDLPLKVFECLVFLIEHRDRAVGRDELVANVWGKVDLSDNALSMAVLSVRRAVGDSSREQRVIRTVKGFGYRWSVPVEVRPAVPPLAQATVSEPADTATPTPQPSGRTRPVRRARALFALAAGVALAMVGSYLLTRTQRLEDPAARVAVLPLRIEGASADMDWARLGVMDLIGARLRDGGRVVVPSDNIVALARARGDVGEEAFATRVADVTGAGLVLQLRARPVDGGWQVRVSARAGGAPLLLAQTEAADLFDAAEAAIDRLLPRLGLPPRPPVAGHGDGTAERDRERLSSQVQTLRLADQVETARQLIAAAEPALRETPQVRLQAAWLAYQASDWDQAEALFARLGQTLSPDTQPALYGDALFGSSKVALRRFDYAAAEAAATGALPYLRRSGQLASLGEALSLRGALRALQQRPAAEVGEDFAEARVALEAAGDRLGLARLENNIGLAARARDRLEEAMLHARRGADELQRFGDVSTELRARFNVVSLSIFLLDTGSARDAAARVRELLDQAADRSLRVNAMLVLSRYYAADGQIGLADVLLAEALGELGGSDDVGTDALARQLSAERQLEAGQNEAAWVDARWVFEACERIADCERNVQDGAFLVRTQVLAGRVEEARALAATLRAWADSDASESDPAFAALAEARVAAASGQVDAAEAAYRSALAGFEQIGVPLLLREAVNGYADWLIGQGRADRAIGVVERIARFAPHDYHSQLLQARLYQALGHRPSWQAALDHARTLAGDRRIPFDLTLDPAIKNRSISSN